MRRSLIIIALLLLAAPTWAANLVANSSFETDDPPGNTTGLVFWQTSMTGVPACLISGAPASGGATMTQSATYAELGTYSVKIDAPAALYGIQFVASPVTIGASYTATAWVKSDGTNWANFVLANKNDCSATRAYSQSTTWTQLTSTIVATTNELHIIIASGAAMVFYADNVFLDLTANLTPTVTPTSAATATPTITPTALVTPTRLPTNPGGTPPRCGASSE